MPDLTKDNVANRVPTTVTLLSWGDWETVIQQTDRETTVDFLDHLCWAWDVKSEGITPREYLRQFNSSIVAITGQALDRNVNREVQKVRSPIVNY